jgi:spermidine synthase
MNSAPQDLRTAGSRLYLVGFIVLFMELACIRWFASTVVFLQFFTNVVLIAAFLGMSCGCLAAKSETDWLKRFPRLAVITVLAALGVFCIYKRWSDIAIDVGNQVSPQVVFFGTESRNPDVAKFSVPIELIVGAFFVLVTLMFVGVGQVLGRAFDAFPDRLRGYTLNIGGSLMGIVGFSLLSFLQAPPTIWFLVVCAGVGYLLYKERSLTRARLAALISLPILVAVPTIYYAGLTGRDVRWSPYYAIIRDGRGITVNTIGHQEMVPFDEGGATYSLIHLLQRSIGAEPFQDVLIIGAGSGNDLVHALRYNVGRVDAVEIDPVIQDIGIRHNPDQPYQSPRAVRHLDDGRHFLHTTDKKYDLVVYALVDSLILHSSYASIRLESFLFTEEAFADIKRVLKPGGVFVTYNYFRQGWIVERVAAMAEKVWGGEPLILSLPHVASLARSDTAGFMMVLVTSTPRIAEAFETKGAFWLHQQPPRNAAVNGFEVRPDEMPQEERRPWLKIAPTQLVHDAAAPPLATDDWPFLYLRERTIPDLSLRSMLVLGGLGLVIVYFFLPKGPGRLRFYPRMFFLGAGFMLLETKAVVQLALLFGSTWLVNSLVFFTVLVLILLANAYVIRANKVHLAWHYVGLAAFLAIGALAPVSWFLSGGLVVRYVLPSLIAVGPMFFAGVIFARLFRDAADPDLALGSNIAGTVVGGLAESVSMLLGFRYLLLVALAFYSLSIWRPATVPRSPDSRWPLRCE